MEGGFNLPNSNFGPMLGSLPPAGMGGGGGFEDSKPFDISTEDNGTKIVNCRLVCGAVELTCDDTEVEIPASGTAYAYARIDHGYQGSTPESNGMLRVHVCTGTLPSTTVRYTIRTLYSFKNGAVDVDYRYSPVVIAAI